MLEITDLFDYIIDGCVFDIWDMDSEQTIEEGMSQEELQEWCDNHSYELCSFEPCQRKEDNEVVFGIVFNVCNIEER